MLDFMMKSENIFQRTDSSLYCIKISIEMNFDRVMKQPLK